MWSVTANELKRGIDRARNVGLWLAIGGAVLVTVAGSVTDLKSAEARALAAAGGVLVGLAPLARRGADLGPVIAWTRARSASEALKTEVYGYLAGSTTYAVADRDRVLRARFHRIVDDVADLQPGAAAAPRSLPPVTDLESYVEHRVRQQVDGYYRPKAALYNGRLVRIRRAEAALGVLAVALGAISAGGGTEGAAAWVPVATTVSAALVAHASASRYQHLVLEFRRTANQLEHLLHRLADKDLDHAAFVDECEQVISVENQAWMAKWQSPA